MAADSDVGTCLLPLARIKTIMKSSPEISNISQESLFGVAKATELFVRDLSQKALEQSGDRKSVDYKDLSEIVNSQETLMFLTDIIPKKITVKEYYASMGRKPPGPQASQDKEN